MQWKQCGKGKENKMKKNIVNVLGTEYEIRCDTEIGKNLLSAGKDGECDLYAKVINVIDISQVNDTREDGRINSWNSTLRHELMHAFFTEAGVDKYSWDETLVDFIAMQFPKIRALFKEVGCDD